MNVIKSEGRPGSTATMPTRRLSYLEIASDLQARIKSDEYPPGTQLPSYGQLAEMYSVSVTTAQSAMRLLRERGLTRSELGRGTFVLDPPPSP